MIETFTALLFAHALAAFGMQTAPWRRRRPGLGGTALMAALALLAAQAATGQPAHPALLLLALSHPLIEIARRTARPSLGGFLAAQALHLAVALGLSLAVPDLWATGLWHALPWLLPLMALGAGALLTLGAGQDAVALLMRPHGARIRNNGLRDGGRMIGMLERGLILGLILLGQPLGVGFLVAAKSILRFGTATRDQRTAEYVIIGTLASFGWAIGAAHATLALLSALPPLEIAGAKP